MNIALPRRSWSAGDVTTATDISLHIDVSHYDGPLGLFRQSVRGHANPIGAGFSDVTQIVIPIDGAFTWRTAGEPRLIDGTALLIVRPGEEFRETHPIHGVGHSGLILTPAREILSEAAPAIARTPGSQTDVVPEAARLLAHQITSPRLSALHREEAIIHLMRVVDTNSARSRSPVATPIVERAKELLHERLDENVTLAEVAGYVGVSPVYLTQTFSRSEGIPLHRYHMRLRLSRALARLREEPDLTVLAHDLGFSSHSHFTAAFRKAFGAPPSELRAWW